MPAGYLTIGRLIALVVLLLCILALVGAFPASQVLIVAAIGLLAVCELVP